MSALEFQTFGPGAAGRAAFDTLTRGKNDPLAPGALCVLALRGGQAVARASLQPAVDLKDVEADHSLLLGHYESADDEAGPALLAYAVSVARARGCVRLIGPMNGNTWYGYRLALPPAAEDPAFDPPAFYGEVANPSGYAGHFAAAGFAESDHYESRIYEDLSQRNPRGAETEAAIAAHGIVLRNIDLNRFDQELERLYAMSLAAFARNRFYGPIALEAFKALYHGMDRLLDPELVVLAEDAAGRTAGLVLAYPDQAQPKRIVLKTLACAPETRGIGLAVHLAERVHLVGHRKGYQSCIHALMHVDNRSAALSQKNASKLFKRYALFEWKA
jgi:GNAT superfamily N-acetyltransferase